MNKKPADTGEPRPSKCPFHRLWSRKTTADTASANPALPPDAQFRPKSKREGIGPFKYVYWNAFYWVLETLNRGLARDPNRKVSWDKWPPFLGLMYLLAKIRMVRSNAITDPYDYATKDTQTFGDVPDAERRKIHPDGMHVSDNENPQMGAANTRFGSNIPPKKVRPDVENMRPSAREVGKLRWRKIDPVTGREITVNAMILNDMAGWWIQFQFHGFGGNTKRDPVTACPHLMRREKSENWPDGDVAYIDRTSVDHTRVTDNGRPTPINERVQAWVQGQIYGTNEAELKRLRSFAGGKFALDENGHLPNDPDKQGIDLTGFANNYGPGLSFLHWLFVNEHNAIADYYAYFHPEWDDEMLFQMARIANCAQIARIHTIQWTEDLLQHPTLQLGMHADWYGFLGQRRKMWLMRMCQRYPLVEKATRWLRGNDIISGMPGSSWTHHDGPFQVPKHFRLVYRLHEMVLGEHEIIDPKTNATLDRIQLLDFVHNNTRPIVEKFGYEVLAWSFVRKSAGHLVPHNVTRALTQFKNQQDGTYTDITERDAFRERADGSGSYQEFRASVGEPPVESFMELCGGDAEMARELEIMYEGDLDKVDAGIGIIVEPKPAGFALGFTQFYQFVLNAPRRVKSNRFLTELFNYGFYLEGMDWVEHGGGMLGAMYRHLPALRANMEGVERAFAPWPETETFPKRMLDRLHEHTANVFKSDAKTLVLGAVTAGVAVCTGVVPWTTALMLLAAIAVIPMALTVKRMLAMRFLQLVWRKCYTDKRGVMFGTLERAEQSMDAAAHFGKAHALAVILGSLGLAWTFWAASPIVSILLVIVALQGMRTRKWATAFAHDSQLVKISLRNRLREGQPVTDSATMPGSTDIERRYWFLRGNNAEPVATFRTCYHGLRNSGLPAWKAFGSTLVSLISFGPRSRKGLTREQKRRLPFCSIYLPGLIKAKGYASTRIYAAVGNTKSLVAGNIDMQEFELMCMRYAPGRDHFTAYDFARMREGNARRDADEGRGWWLARILGKFAAKRRADQLLLLFADRVVEEDKKLVPAISHDMLLRFYQGSAQADLYREHTEGDAA